MRSKRLKQIDKEGIKVFLLLAFAFIFSIVCASASEIKYSTSYLPGEDYNELGVTSGNINEIKTLLIEKENSTNLIESKYPAVEIREDKIFGIINGERILDLEIIDHTEYCTVDCYSILKITVYQKTKLIEQIETRGIDLIYNNNTQIKVYLLKNISYPTEIPELKEECTTFSIGNGKTASSCINKRIGFYNGIEYKEEFVEYNNEEVETGVYIIKVTGKKSFNQEVDWVPTIAGKKIERLAWWGISQPYGNGSLGDLYFSASTKTYGNMVLNVDYTVSGNTLYLKTDRVYTFNNMYLGPGTTLSTQNTTGAAIYILAMDKMNIQGNINLKNIHLPGSQNTSTFSFLGDSFSTPSVASGASAYNGEPQANGFGGGARGGTGTIIGCSYGQVGAGSTGGYPFGNGGASAYTSSSNDGCVIADGNSGLRSGGGSGASTSKDTGSGCTISATSGAGGNSYGANGGEGSTSGSRSSTWNCVSGAFAAGGGGAGGSAGSPGYNLVLRGKNLTLLGTIDLSGTNGTKGGNGGRYHSGNWQNNVWKESGTGDSGAGGGGGGGASAGSIKIYYRYLTNTSTLNSLISMTAGIGGSGGTFYSGAGAAGTGGSGSSGTLTIYEEGFADTILISPANGSSAVISPLFMFIANISVKDVTVLNSTFNLWNGSSWYVNTTSLSATSNISVNWTRNSSEINDGTYIWFVDTCYTDGLTPKCESSSNNTFDTFTVSFSNTTYNNFTQEMVQEVFSVNVTSTGFVNLSGQLVFDGISYDAITTGNNINATLTSTIWIPTGVGNKSFYWDLSYGGQSKISDSNNVTVNASIFDICNYTLNSTSGIATHNESQIAKKKFVTIIYIDETTNTQVKASVVNSIWNYNITNSPYGKQLIFSSPFNGSTQYVSWNHSFCFFPQNYTIDSSASYQYGNIEEGYATKIWPFSLETFSNSTTVKTLYLIKLTDSGTTPVTFQLINGKTNTVVGGVTVDVYRTIAGVPTLVDTGVSDTAGVISYYLSPITAYTIVTSGGNCNPLTSTVTPTSSQYNLVLVCDSGVTAASTILDGVSFVRTPKDGVSIPALNTTFEYRVMSNNSNIVRAKFEIVDAIDSTVYASNETIAIPGTSCNSTSCYLSFQYNTYTGDNIKGRYYVDINGTYVLLEGDAYWRYIYINKNTSLNAAGRLMYLINDFFHSGGEDTANCKLYQEEGSCSAVSDCKWVEDADMCVMKDELNKIEFDRIVTVFFVLSIILFILGKTTGYEMAHPGAFVMSMGAIIAVLSYYGMFTFQGLTTDDFLNKWLFAIITNMMGITYTLSIIRRYQG